MAATTTAAAAAAGNSILGRQPRQPPHLRRDRAPSPLPLRPPLRPRSSSSRRDRAGGDLDPNLDLAALWSRDEIDLPAFWAQLEAPDRAAPRGTALGAARVLELASLAEVRGVAGGGGGAHDTHTCICTCMCTWHRYACARAYAHGMCNRACVRACRCAAGGSRSTGSCCVSRRDWRSRWRGCTAHVHVHTHTSTNTWTLRLRAGGAAALWHHARGDTQVP